MKYQNIKRAIFVNRKNRFIATVEIDGMEQEVHVKNTGRCRELLVHGAVVYLEKSNNTSRKTRYDLVAVEKGDRLINMDSQIPNDVAEEWLRSGDFIKGITYARREVTYGNSRFDLYFEYINSSGENVKAFMEVKGVTLEDDGIVRFPDAPTIRGIKHIQELAKSISDGYEAYLLFVIQMKDVRFFEPDKNIHADFAFALSEAQSKGVHILAYDCDVTENSISLRKEVEVRV